MCLYNRIIGQKPVTHGTAPTFPISVASRQAGYAVQFYCVPCYFVPRFFLRHVLKVIQIDFLLRLF